MMMLPPGFRFCPIGEEIILYLLQNKVNGRPLPHYNIAQECDIYGDKEPWIIFDKIVEQGFYVFTKLKKKSNSGLNIQLKTSCGTWKGQNTINITYENQVIGFKKLFIFDVDGKDLALKAKAEESRTKMRAKFQEVRLKGLEA
ncbi:hypothetical protein Tsubulata_021751 [Turnera subulata]|uniref:NAC domain-containing protein n=1 Tax=Turnera subulata TaxID=218843 RepID=A0A9Q0FF86_9ROSI|nr:hypothetical protein Tsubulata_021751 [Turnera subulata]